MRFLCPWQAGSDWQYASVSMITPQINFCLVRRFIRRHPIKSGATNSAGLQKNSIESGRLVIGEL